MEKLFITNIYWFYLFSVFWLTKVVTILFNDYSVIVSARLFPRFELKKGFLKKARPKNAFG